jgi:hypothetical protein
MTGQNNSTERNEEAVDARRPDKRQAPPPASLNLSTDRSRLNASRARTGVDVKDRGASGGDLGPFAAPHAGLSLEDVGTTTLIEEGAFPSPNPLIPGFPGLFIQTGGRLEDLHAAAALTRTEGMGIVFTIGTRVKHYHERLTELVQEHRRIVGPVEHVLVDVARYAGPQRRVGTRLDPEWVKAQRAAGLSVLLTDSPYLPSGAHATLVSTLTQARTFGTDVVAVLPLHLDWLVKNAELTFLIETINAAGIPVAIVLEHTGDPLGPQGSVTGLVRLLAQAEVKVGLLRSDLSVIGAVAFGATLGAVGTTTGLRHLYPVKKGGGYHEPRIAALVSNCMAYKTLEKINAAIGADPHNQHRWTCRCDYCYGRSLDCITSETHAYQHSLSAISRRGSSILGGATDLDRRRAWLGACLHAQTTNYEIQDETGMTWEPPAFLGAWHKLASTLPALAPTTR